jgi:DNA polymerase III subunit epsilon
MFFRSPAWDAVTYCALDLETSGLRPQSDKILSVGIVPVRGGVIHYGERYYSLVRPPDPASLSEEGLRAHHILPAELECAPPLADVLVEIDTRMRDSVLLVHFADVDVGFLKQAYRRADMNWPRPPVVDTVRLMMKLHERQHHLTPYPAPIRTALTEAREDIGLPPHDSHHALGDALATAELFLAVRARIGARTLRELR